MVHSDMTYHSKTGNLGGQESRFLYPPSEVIV